MNAQPANIDPEDVLQRMAREVGTLAAEKHIAESQRDAAFRQVAELTEQVVAGQTQINAVTAELTEAQTERDELLREVEKLRPERDGHDPDRDGGGEDEREGYGYP